MMKSFVSVLVALTLTVAFVGCNKDYSKEDLANAVADATTKAQQKAADDKAKQDKAINELKKKLDEATAPVAPTQMEMEAKTIDVAGKATGGAAIPPGALKESGIYFYTGDAATEHEKQIGQERVEKLRFKGNAAHNAANREERTQIRKETAETAREAKATVAKEKAMQVKKAEADARKAEAEAQKAQAVKATTEAAAKAAAEATAKATADARKAKTPRVRKFPYAPPAPNALPANPPPQQPVAVTPNPANPHVPSNSPAQVITNLQGDRQVLRAACGN